MKNFRHLAALLVLAVCFTLAFRVAGRADFGDYSGNSDYNSGGSYDGGSYDGGYGYGGSPGIYYSSDGSEGGTDPLMIFLTVAVIVVIVLVNMKRQGERSGREHGVPVTTRKPAKGRPVSTYREVDPEFDEAAFSEKLSNLYVQMQNAWTGKDIEPVRPYFTDAFFAQMERQLEQKRAAHETNYVERIAVLSAMPETWYQENGMDHIVAVLRTRIVDYTLNDDTGELISGSRTAEKFMTYEWDLARKTGIRTEKNPEVRTVNCPNCGAPVQINATAKCPYCGSVITVKQEDWAITSIRALAQRTGSR
jgi:DNA-directed RNA polymerase subunit RPC12/RpoP